LREAILYGKAVSEEGREHVISGPDLWLLLEEEKLPSEVRREDWGFVSRENALAYLTPTDLHIAWLQFKAYRALIMITTPRALKHEVAKQLLNLKRYFESRITRSSYGFWSLLLRSRFTTVSVEGQEKKPSIFKWRRD